MVGYQMIRILSAVTEYPVQLCFVNCGLPGEQCACFRAQMQAVRAGLTKQLPVAGETQEPLWLTEAGFTAHKGRQ